MSTTEQTLLQFYRGDLVEVAANQFKIKLPREQRLVYIVDDVYEMHENDISRGYESRVQIARSAHLADWSGSFERSDLTLVSRGNRFNYLFGTAPLEFSSLHEALSFWCEQGQAVEQPTRAGLYAYTKDEAIAALREGFIDAIDGVFGRKTNDDGVHCVSGYKLYDFDVANSLRRRSLDEVDAIFDNM